MTVSSEDAMELSYFDQNFMNNCTRALPILIMFSGKYGNQTDLKMTDDVIRDIAEILNKSCKPE